jgi:DNA-binding NtrC family response regulator
MPERRSLPSESRKALAHILIIDDDDSLRVTMRKILQLAGHTVEEAEDGEVGLSVFRARPADLVVTDLVMPEKEGIETIQELREESPDLPILAISGGTSVDRDGPLLDAEAFGANASLAKPFDVTEFQDAVERLLTERE